MQAETTQPPSQQHPGVRSYEVTVRLHVVDIRQLDVPALPKYDARPIEQILESAVNSMILDFAGNYTTRAARLLELVVKPDSGGAASPQPR